MSMISEVENPEQQPESTSVSNDSENSLNSLPTVSQISHNSNDTSTDSSIENILSPGDNTLPHRPAPAIPRGLHTGKRRAPHPPPRFVMFSFDFVFCFVLFSLLFLLF